MWAYPPTAFQSPDATLGGSAMTSPGATGHAETTVSSGFGPSSVSASCRWHTVTIPEALTLGAHHRLSVKLRVTHSSDGGLFVAGQNSFTLSYSTNNGGSWTNIVARTNFTGLQSATAEIVLPNPHLVDVSQIQVRDHATADAATESDAANVICTVSGIEVEIRHHSHMLIMM